jgi:signal transduction histidine kinase
MPGGRVRVSAGTLTDGSAVLTVANTGPVVPAGEIERLLQPFQRLAAGRAGGHDGHGLGLSIIAAIARAHDADLSVQLAPGGGLDIRITFGAARPRPARRSRPARPGRPRLAARTLTRLSSIKGTVRAGRRRFA